MDSDGTNLSPKETPEKVHFKKAQATPLLCKQRFSEAARAVAASEGRKSATFVPKKLQLRGNGEQKGFGTKVPPVDSYSKNGSTKKLSSFGIKLGDSATGARARRDSYLRAAITEPPNTELVFKFDPQDPNFKAGSWSEKILCESIKRRDAWTIDLGFNSTFYPCYYKNEEQKNSKGYTQRMFGIPTQDVPSMENLLAAMEYICEMVNRSPGNNTLASVNKNNIFWMDGKVTWSDIIGRQNACTRLQAQTGPIGDGYYEQNETLIHSHFPSETLTMEECQLFGAPLEQLHPGLRHSVAVSTGRYDLMLPSQKENNGSSASWPEVPSDIEADAIDATQPDKGDGNDGEDDEGEQTPRVETVTEFE